MATVIRGKTPEEPIRRSLRVHPDLLPHRRLADDGTAMRSWSAEQRAEARGQAREIVQAAPKRAGLRRRAGSVFSRMASLLLMRLPMPAEMKWQYALDFVGDLTIEYYQDLAKNMPEPEARVIVVRTLSAAGRRWIRDMTNKQGVSLTSTPVLADVLKLVFRTLNIDSTVESRRGEVEVTNHACPYLARATEQGMASARMCEMICGDVTSLMDGVSQGLPAPVRYRSQTMMGQGDRVCTKHFGMTRGLDS